MMTKKIADIKARVGEYTNREGEKKGRWIDVGYVLEMDDKGKMRCYYPWINLAGIPRKEGYDSVTLSEFEVKDDKKPATHKGHDAVGNGPAKSDMDDEIPFDVAR